MIFSRHSHYCDIHKLLFIFLLPSECLNHEAVQLVSKSCYSKQKCTVAVSNQTFRDPCFPGTRKYLSVLYSCGMTLSCFLIHIMDTQA